MIRAQYIAGTDLAAVRCDGEPRVTLFVRTPAVSREKDPDRGGAEHFDTDAGAVRFREDYTVTMMVPPDNYFTSVFS